MDYRIKVNFIGLRLQTDSLEMFVNNNKSKYLRNIQITFSILISLKMFVNNNIKSKYLRNMRITFSIIIKHMQFCINIIYYFAICITKWWGGHLQNCNANGKIILFLCSSSLE